MSHPGGTLRRVSLPVPVSLSPSKVTAFQDCPMAFKFSAIDRIPQPPRPATTKGTLVHRALELLMLREPSARTLDAALADLDRGRQELASHPDYLLLDLTPDDAVLFHAEAETLVRRYFQLEDPATVRPIGLEVMVSMPLGAAGPGGVPVVLRGIIDRLELTTSGELVITDYKTGAPPSESYEHAKLAGVHIYALLCERVVGRRPVRVQLFYLQKPEAIIAEPTDQKVHGVERRTRALWTAVERACHRDDFRPRPGRLCDYCAYRPYCPAWGGDPALAVELKEGLQRRLPVTAA
jgi:putative RecB family exonuclease